MNQVCLALARIGAMAPGLWLAAGWRSDERRADDRRALLLWARALEPLAVPAGNFDTCRIEVSGEAAQDRLVKHKGAFRIDAETQIPVRADLVVRCGGGVDQFYSLRLRA